MPWKRFPVTRLFVALEMPGPLRAALAGLQSSLPGARWVQAEGMHLTLAFIGEVDDARRQAVESALKSVAGAPFSLCLGGLARYPRRGPPRVLWSGAAPEREIAALADAIRAALEGVGLALERRPFRAHVTLARFRRPPPRADLERYLDRHSAFATPPADIDSFHLYSSHLQSTGARYRKEATFPLGS